MTLPEDVRGLALRLGANETRVAGQSLLTQTGEVKLSPDSDRWYAFSARQTMAVTACAFQWRARIRPIGYLTVTDALQAGKGQSDVTALGVVPWVRRPASVALTKIEMIRYLAELPYAPDAMLHNRALGWRVLDTNRIAVSAGPAAMQIEVIFALDVDGRVASATAQDRPRSTQTPYLPTPWSIEFSDYRLQHGRWVPFAGQAAWRIDGVQTPCWRGMLSGWSMSSPPFAAPVKAAASRTVLFQGTKP